MGTQSYKDVKEAVERPIKNRGEILTKKGKYVVPRKYHLTNKELEKMNQEKQIVNEIGGNAFINPHTKMGCYHASIEALRILGLDEWHSFASVKGKMQEVMSASKNSDGETAWEVFDKRQTDTGKDVNGKLMYNFVVLQRLTGNHPYGEKLRQMKACIDVKAEGDTILYRLNTQFETYEDVKPFNNTLKKRGRKKKV